MRWDLTSDDGDSAMARVSFQCGGRLSSSPEEFCWGHCENLPMDGWMDGSLKLTGCLKQAQKTLMDNTKWGIDFKHRLVLC